MEQKKVQEKAKREHRRVMLAVDEFLKVENNDSHQIIVTCVIMFNFKSSLAKTSYLWHNVL